MESITMEKLQLAALEALEEAQRRCTGLILDAVQAKNQNGMQLVGEVSIKLREIIETLQHPVSAKNDEIPKSSPASGARTDRKASKREYPKFYVESGNLCKVGWSKKAKKEYIHKLSKEAFQQVLEIISRRTVTNGEPFPAEEILQEAQQLSDPIPDYQVYLALAFLQKCEILEKNGRRGYSARKSVKESGFAAWESVQVN